MMAWLYNHIGAILLILTILLVVAYVALRYQAKTRITPYKLDSFKLYALSSPEKEETKQENIVTDEPTVDLSIVFPAYNEQVSVKNSILTLYRTDSKKP
jgi:hypothetical protein